MLSQIASEKTLETSSRAAEPPRPAHPLRLIEGLRAKMLIDLGWNDCRFCVADAPEGEMHRALFCAAPVGDGEVYCAAHGPRCRRPPPDDGEQLLAEIEAALAPRP